MFTEKRKNATLIPNMCFRAVFRDTHKSAFILPCHVCYLLGQRLYFESKISKNFPLSLGRLLVYWSIWLLCKVLGMDDRALAYTPNVGLLEYVIQNFSV